MCHIYWLIIITIIIYHYIPSRISRKQMKAHSWTSCSLFATKAARTVPWWTWGHFECNGGALPLCGVSSWTGVPLPFTTLDCCCPLVSTEGMNILLNFANSITLSLIIVSLSHRLRYCIWPSHSPCIPCNHWQPYWFLLGYKKSRKYLKKRRNGVTRVLFTTTASTIRAARDLFTGLESHGSAKAR